MWDHDLDGSVGPGESPGCAALEEPGAPPAGMDSAQVDSQALDSGADSELEDNGWSTGPADPPEGQTARTFSALPEHPCSLDPAVHWKVTQAGRARFSVKDEASAEYPSIGSALVHAQAGDVICVYGGEHGTTFTENVIVEAAVHLEAVGDVTIDGGGLSAALNVTDGAGDATIKGFTLTNAEDCREDGDCRVLEISSSSPVIEDVLIYGGEASAGAGIRILGGSPSFQDVEVVWAGSEADPLSLVKKASVFAQKELNVAAFDDVAYAGILYRDQVLTVASSKLLSTQRLAINKRNLAIAHARSATASMSFHSLASTTLEATHAELDSRFDLGIARQYVYNEACAQPLIDFVSYTAYYTTYSTTATSGGAIYVESGSPTFTNLIVTDSAATTGAALYVAGGSVTVNHGTLLSPDATISGAGVTVYVRGGSLTLYNSLVRGNTSATVMGKASSGSISAYDSAFWAEGDLDAAWSGFTLGATNRTTLDPWWCAQPSDLSLPSNADEFFTNPDGILSTSDYVGAVSP